MVPVIDVGTRTCQGLDDFQLALLRGQPQWGVSITVRVVEFRLFVDQCMNDVEVSNSRSAT